MDPKAEAKRKLVYYFRLIAGRADIFWDGDNDTEIEDAVDDIIKAAVQAVEKKMAEQA